MPFSTRTGGEGSNAESDAASSARCIGEILPNRAARYNVDVHCTWCPPCFLLLENFNLPELFAGRYGARGSGRVGSGRVGSGRVGSGRVGLP